MNGSISRRKMMSKFSVPVLIAVLFFFAFNVAAKDENPVFKSLHCGICHKVDTGKVYPSIKEIAVAYKGDSAKLEKYLQGEADSIVNQEKSKTMERYIEKTKALSEDDRKSLAGYILSCKD